jgi:hypothetical protein
MNYYIAQLIAQLDATLRKHNLNNYAKLQAPLPEDEIAAYFERLGIDDADLRALYGWKNGFDFSHGIATTDKVFKFGMLRSLEQVEASLSYQMPEEAGFIAIVSDDWGDSLSYNNHTGPDHGKIHLFSVSLLSIDPPYSLYDSVAAMLQTTIEAYSKGALKYDEKEDWLNEDIDLYHKIAKKLNKKSEYWKL